MTVRRLGIACYNVNGGPDGTYLEERREQLRKDSTD